MASVTSTSSNTNNGLYSAADTSKTAAAANSQSSASSASGSSALANESTFLTLLVAQLKNQDPSQPADGMQFVTQLAQFSSLEQNLAMRTDLDSINKQLTSTTASGSTGSSTTGTGSSSAV